MSFIELENVNGLMNEQGPSNTSTDAKAGKKGDDRYSIANHIVIGKDNDHVYKF